MKYYAVKVGNHPGIFETWEECNENIKGYKGAKYKSFKLLEEAEIYINSDDCEEKIDEEINNVKSIESLADDEIIIYTDGSSNKELNFSSYGVVCLHKSQPEYRFSGIVKDINRTKNISGEIAGVLKALEYAKYKGKKKAYIYHDYEGLSKWHSGEWGVNSSDSIYYLEQLKQYEKDIQIEFVKVKAHSGNKYNEICDKLAKNELKSLEPSTSDEWGFKSFRYNDDIIRKVLSKIKLFVDNFEYVEKEKSNHYDITCFLGKEKLCFQKYKFDSTNQLLIPKNQSDKIYSLLISYLNDYNSINSMIFSLNINNNTKISEDTIKSRLYSISPQLKNKNINQSIYKLIIQSVYNLFLDVQDVADSSYLTTPALRALEGHLKFLFKEKLSIDISTDGFHYFDKSNIGEYNLQKIYVEKLEQQEIDYINLCYNKYNIIRHKLLHFGDLDVDDTKLLTTEESKKIIADTIILIGNYYE